MKDESKRQRDYYKRQQEKGMKKVALFIPQKGADDFWAAVKRLRTKWKKKGWIEDKNH